MCVRYPDYLVTFHGIGPGPDGTGERLGCCSQLAMFVRMDFWRSTIHNCSSTDRDERNIDGAADGATTEYHLNEIHDDIRKIDLNSPEICDTNDCPDDVSIKELDSVEVVLTATSAQSDDEPINEWEYKLLGSFKFPINIDDRTRNERLLDEARFQIARFEHMQGDYYNYDTCKYDVPLEMISRFIVQEDHTIDELRYVLE